MYESFYGFREKPFSLLPDPEFLYLSRMHKSAFSVLEYGLVSQAGFIVISGEVGSGKTTLVRSFLKRVDDDAVVGLISSTPKAFGNLLHWIFRAFDLEYQGKKKVDLYQNFTDFLIAQYAAGVRCVLIIDEAQNLDAKTLEELRMLSNVNVGKDLLLQIILVGQPELMDTLKRPDLRQFSQRIAISCQLEALGRDETHEYVRHRLKVAGGDPMIFTTAACDAVYHLSKGIPRLINGLCDIALVYGFGEGNHRIDMDIVLSVFEDQSQSGIGLGSNAPERDALFREILRFEAELSEKASSRMASMGAASNRAAANVKPQSKPDTSGVVSVSSRGDGPSRPVTPKTNGESAAEDAERVMAPEMSASSPTRPGPRPPPSDRELAPDYAEPERNVKPRHGRLLWLYVLIFMTVVVISLWLTTTPATPDMPGPGAIWPFLSRH